RRHGPRASVRPFPRGRARPIRVAYALRRVQPTAAGVTRGRATTMGDARSRLTTADAGATAPAASGAPESGRPTRIPGPEPRPGDIRPDAPPEAPEPKPVPLMRALLPVVMLVAVVGMVPVMVVSGSARNPITFMFPLLMVVSTLGMMAGGASGAADVGPARRDYQRHLASVRRAVADAVGMQR